MGLYVQSLNNIPESAKRDYFIYLLDYGWHEPLGEALSQNFANMAKLADDTSAVVIAGTNRVHFEDEVLSWHNINGQDAEDILPAILITNRHPARFRESYGRNKTLMVEEDLKLILIPLKKCCASTSDVVTLIHKLFRDIKDKKDLKDFSIQKEIKKGIGSAVADSIILEPNLSGVGLDIKKLFNYLRGK